MKYVIGIGGLMLIMLYAWFRRVNDNKQYTLVQQRLEYAIAGIGGDDDDS